MVEAAVVALMVVTVVTAAGLDVVVTVVVVVVGASVVGLGLVLSPFVGVVVRLVGGAIGAAMVNLDHPGSVGDTG